MLMTELNISKTNNLNFLNDDENFLIKSLITSLTQMKVLPTINRFPVLAEDLNNNNKKTLNSNFLNCNINVKSKCLTNNLTQTKNLCNKTNLTVKIKKKNKKHLGICNKTILPKTNNFIKSSSYLNLTNNLNKINKTKQSTSNDSVNCDCISFALLASLRLNRIKNQKLNKKFNYINNNDDGQNSNDNINNDDQNSNDNDNVDDGNNDDDDSYRKCLKYLAYDIENIILLSPPKKTLESKSSESLLLDSGVPSSISSSSSTSEQLNSTIDNNFTLTSNKNKKTTNNINNLFSPNKLPAPPPNQSINNRERRLFYKQKFYTLLTNVVRKVFDVSRNKSSNNIIDSTTITKNPSLVLNIVSKKF